MVRNAVHYAFLNTLTMGTSVGVLEDKSSSSRILEYNFEVLGLGLGLEG